MDIFSGFAGTLFDFVCNIIMSRIKGNELFEAYYIELKNNRALLRAVDFDRIGAAHINDASFRSLVQALQIQVAASIVFDPGKKRRKAFEKFLSAKTEIVLSSETEDDQIDPVNDIMAALSFTVRKITELKTLTIAAENGRDLLHGFNLAVRIKNIDEAFKTIDVALSDYRKAAGA